MMTLQEHAALNICQVRHEQKVSVAQLAKRLGCSRQYIYQIESGAVSISLTTIEEIAKALGVHSDRLTQTGSLAAR